MAIGNYDDVTATSPALARYSEKVERALKRAQVLAMGLLKVFHFL